MTPNDVKRLAAQLREQGLSPNEAFLAARSRAVAEQTARERAWREQQERQQR